MNKFAHIELDEKKLAKETLEYIYSIENTYLECSLFISILNPLEKYENLKNQESYLLERLSKLEFYVDYDEVKFENKLTGYNDDTFEQTKRLGEKMFSIENFSKEIFWANQIEEKNYKSISDFNCFEAKTIPKDKFKNTIINVPFNIEGWVIYYQNLLALKFQEFSEEILSGKNVIKYRHFKDNFFLGIETNYQSFKSNLKKDNVEPVHKLIIFKKLKNEKIEKIVIFDKFVHPHFNPPAYSFGWYFYAKNTIYVSDREMSVEYTVERELLNDGNVRLSMSEKFGEHLKRHIYFYYDMLYHTTNEYIKFIEESFNPEE